jgi:tetraacyldisaccharide 4'-kinase
MPVQGGLPRFWLRDGWSARLLAPAGWAAGAAAMLRRRLYQAGVLRARRLPVPVIVVGNIFVGGTGKTPLVCWLCERLQARGRRPGIVLRGYGGRATRWPQAVAADSDPDLVGDEAVLLARRTGVPVAAGPARAAAAALLVEAGCDVVVSDDGLQHYALARDIEIAVIDAARGIGNGRCLPAGPLREPPSRLATVDLVIANGGENPLTPFCFRLAAEPLRPLGPIPAAPPAGGRAHAVAGIGNPQRFFEQLRRQGFELIEHAFPDHHRYRPDQLNFADGLPILMTEKDAVKIAGFTDGRCWVLPVRAEPDPATREALDALLARV